MSGQLANLMIGQMPTLGYTSELRKGRYKQWTWDLMATTNSWNNIHFSTLIESNILYCSLLHTVLLQVIASLIIITILITITVCLNV